MSEQRNRLFLILGILFYLVVYFLYYPPIFAYTDESGYLSMAYILRHGTLFADRTDIPPLNAFVLSRGHQVFYGSIAVPLGLLPLTFLGWKSIFLWGMSFHLLGTLFFHKLTRLFKLGNPLFSLLYLFFPAFVFYSRTIMSDIPCTTLFLIGYYFYVRPQRSKFVSGLFFGMSIFFRLSSLVLTMPFGGMLFWKAWREKQYRPLSHFLWGVVPFLILIGGYHSLCHGSPFLTSYSKEFTGVEYFHPRYFWSHLMHYTISLMLVYPLMLLSPIFTRETRKIENILAVSSLLMLYSFFYFHDQFLGRWVTWAFATRYLFPIIPIFLLSYSEWLNDHLKKIPRPMAGFLEVLGVAFLMAGCVAINHQHQEYLRRQWALKETIYRSTEERSVVIYDSNAAELIQKIWGRRIYLQYNGYEKIQEALKRVDFSKKVYLVKRDLIYAGREKIEGIREKDFLRLGRDYKLDKIAQKDGLSVFKLTPLR